MQNSNTNQFMGPRLGAPAVDQRFPEEDAFEAIRQFIKAFGTAANRRATERRQDVAE